MIYKINNREVSNKEFFSSKEDGVHQAYINGILWYEFNYLNGQRHGLQREWYEDGTLQYEWIFVNGTARTKEFANNRLAQVVIFGKVIYVQDKR